MSIEVINTEQAAAWDGHDVWTEQADRYDRASRRIWQRFKERKLIGRADDVVDLGCGTGGPTRDVARSACEGEVTGIDLSSGCSSWRASATSRRYRLLAARLRRWGYRRHMGRSRVAVGSPPTALYARQLAEQQMQSDVVLREGMAPGTTTSVALGGEHCEPLASTGVRGAGGGDCLRGRDTAPR